MGWAERANPQSRLNRRLTGALYRGTTQVVPKLKFTSKVSRLFSKVSRLFSRMLPFLAKPAPRPQHDRKGNLGVRPHVSGRAA